MARVGFAMCLVIVAMDITAGMLGIQAEITKNKMMIKCKDKETSDEVFRLGLAAAALLGVSHLVTNLLAGCVCICYAPELETSSANRQFLFACLILSWIVVAVGFPMLTVGMLENRNSKSKESCGALEGEHDHFLFIGGILCILHALLTIFFCWFYLNRLFYS